MPFRDPSVSRRSFLLAAATSTATIAVPRWSVAAVEGPRLLLIGGSLIAGAFGIYLRKALRAEGYSVKREGKSASGLARPDFYNWPRVAAALLEAYQPDAVAVMFGANDAQGQRMPRGHDPRWLRWHEDGWQEEYRRRVRAFADLVAGDDDRQIYWFGMPAMGQRRLDERVQVINAIYAQELADRASCFYYETRPHLADTHSRFVDHLEIDGKLQRIRAHDGIHIAGPGATRLVQVYKPEIMAHLRIIPSNVQRPK